ncbi:MAG TPA: DUF1292 domain-containing protein [Lachnospiraceae bacterium]|nr:DUF1292 domain-containing protein [Lachnospiraceae bacterium]HPF29057.1 DUF1292 domain-containing protein [Lachnospiraceae bacterium]
MMDKKKNESEDEEIYVEIELDDKTVTCSIVTIFSVGEKDYIALLPLDENKENHDGNVWIYGYVEDGDDEDTEPDLIYIKDDDEYEAASDAFEEYLDSQDFDELIDEDDSDEDTTND